MLPHLACRLFGTPLLIQRAKLDVILNVLAPRLNVAAKAEAHPLTAALPLPKTAMPPAQAGAGIAVIPIYGTLVKRTLGLEAASGLTSYLDIAQQLEAALSNPQISGILLDIDSPGGEAAGVFELARRIRTAASIKPVWAQANDSAFSAAYALAAASERLYVTETGGVGSIGVIALHLDQSARDTTEGYRYTAVFAGAHKNDLSPHAPLSTDAHVSLQTEVDRLYALFVTQIAQMRRLGIDTVRATEAALVFGEQALAAGLVDGVQSLERTLDAMQLALIPTRPQSLPARSALLSPAQESPMTTETQATPETPLTISLEEAAAQVADARREAVQSAQAIAELCLIAGCPEQAAPFIASGRSEADVRRALIETRAARSEAQPIQSAFSPASGSVSAPESSPIVAAVKKRIAQE